MWQSVRIVILVIALLSELILTRVLLASDSNVTGKPETGAVFTPSIFVEQQTDCMSIADIKDSLGSVLKNREESKYMIITVVVSPTVEGALAVLRAIDRETGEILLERALNVLPEECADAHLVLRVMLEQFLTGFPIEKWKEKQTDVQPSSKETTAPLVQTEEVLVEKEITFLRWSMLAGIDSRWPSPSGDVELGLGLDAGAARHGLIGQIVLRIGWPHPLGEGRYLESAALLALGWRFSQGDRRLFRVEIRTGALRVSGIGYDKNYHQWLVMLEAELSLLFRAGAIYLGPAGAISPITHTVYTESGERRDLPWIRLGILLGIPIGETLLK